MSSHPYISQKEYGLNYVLWQVIRFHKLFEYPVQETPRRLPGEKKTFWLNMVMEELVEYKEAETLENDIKEILDAIYFLVGMLMDHGISNPQELFNIVHHHNIKNRIWDDGKVHKRNDGKILKRPDSIKPEPFIKELISQQTELK